MLQTNIIKEHNVEMLGCVCVEWICIYIMQYNTTQLVVLKMNSNYNPRFYTFSFSCSHELQRKAKCLISEQK